MSKTKSTDTNIPTDPFNLTLYVYDKLIDFISHSQMISEGFLNPDRALSDIYNPAGFSQLANDLSKEFEIKLTAAEAKKSENIGGLCAVIVEKLSPS